MSEPPALSDAQAINALTVDVEDAHSIISRQWFGEDIPPTRAVVENTDYVIETLSKFNTQATFFVLGEVVETYPELIKRIAAAGHELGVHGHKHRSVKTSTAESFRDQVGPGKKRLEDLTGQKVLGHRAPAFSINLDMTWAFDVLLEAGFRYDSSVYPIDPQARWQVFLQQRYGDPSAALEPFLVAGPEGGLWEIPLATLTFLRRRWPVCGGGYLRHFPGWVNRWALGKINDCQPAVIYIHPYEFEAPEARPADLTWPLGKQAKYAIYRWLQHRNRHTMKSKLARLLRDFRFARIVDVFPCCLA